MEIVQPFEAVENPPATSDTSSAAVATIADTALARLPASVRNRCDRAAIMAALDGIGAADDTALRALLEHDFKDVKAAVGSAAPPAFLATLKQLMATAPLDAADKSVRQRVSQRATDAVRGLPRGCLGALRVLVDSGMPSSTQPNLVRAVLMSLDQQAQLASFILLALTSLGSPEPIAQDDASDLVSRRSLAVSEEMLGLQRTAHDIMRVLKGVALAMCVGSIIGNKLLRDIFSKLTDREAAQVRLPLAG